MNNEADKENSNNTPSDKKTLTISGKSVDKRIFASVFILIFISIFLWQNYLFIKKDVGPKETDNHIFTPVAYYEQIVLKVKNDDLSTIPYPPGLFVSTIPFFIFRGISAETARISLSFFAVIFLLAMFGIGYEYGGYYAGFAVMAVAASSPHILNYSRLYFLDFPQAAMTALAFYFLIRSRGYKDRKVSLLFGFVLALSFLTKWASAFYLIIPVMWFFIPVMFLSKKSFLFSLPVLLYTAIILSGFKWYYGNLSLQPLDDKWILYYFIIVVIPGIILAGIYIFLERRWKRYDNGEDPGIFSTFNATYSSIVFFLISSPWFFYAGRSIVWLWTVNKDKGIVHTMLFKYQYLSAFFKTIFNYFPLLALIGLVYIFIIKKDLYRKLILPVNILILIPLMAKISFPFTRLHLSFVIFASALCGYWVAYTGKARIPITAIIIILSLLSVTAGVVLPGNTPIYHPVNRVIEYSTVPRYPIPVKILRTQPPDTSAYDIEDVINWILPGDQSQPGDVILFLDLSGERSPLSPEHVRWKAVESGQLVNRIKPQLRWCAYYINRIDRQQIAYQQDITSIDSLLIIQKKGENPMIAIERVVDIFSGADYTHKTFDIGRGYQITAINLDRDVDFDD